MDGGEGRGVGVDKGKSGQALHGGPWTATLVCSVAVLPPVPPRQVVKMAGTAWLPG